MATYKTTTLTAQEERATKRNASPSFRELQQPVCIATFTYTLTGSEANTETIGLGALEREGAVIVPELSRVTDTGGTGDVDVDFTLQKVDASGAVTALTGAASVANDSAAFARLIDGDPVAVGHSDVLQLAISSATSVTTDEPLFIEIAYRVPNNV